MFIRKHIAPLMAGITLALATTSSAYAQGAYPEKPIRMVVPWAPGGATDIIARLIGQQLTTRLGQAVVIENKAGAGGNIGTAAFVRENADGYTLLMTTSSTHGINSHLYAKPGFDVGKDFANVAFVGSIPNVLEVPPKSPFSTAQQLIDFARANPGKLNYGSAGIGSSQHLAAAQLIHSAGIDITHVPYKGSGPAVTDLLGGNLDLMLDTGSLSQVKAGALKALAVASKTRLAEFPDVPTFDEVGLKDMYAAAWYGVATHAAVPREIVDRLNKEINEILKQPDMIARLESMGVQVGPLQSPKELDAFVESEGKRFKALVDMSGAKME